MSEPQYAPAFQRPAGPASRPVTVVVAIALMSPVFVTWLVAGFAWLVVTAKTEGDTGRIFLWILAIAILALCLLFALTTAVGIVEAWRGRSAKLRIPAMFTCGLFFIALINLLVHHKISFAPSQVVPLVLGATAGVSLCLLHTDSAVAWCTRSGQH